MTREELFSVFPRPWRDDGPGIILDAYGNDVLVIDVNRDREHEDVVALTDLLVELVNGAEE